MFKFWLFYKQSLFITDRNGYYKNILVRQNLFQTPTSLHANAL